MKRNATKHRRRVRALKRAARRMRMALKRFAAKYGIGKSGGAWRFPKGWES